MAGRSLPPDVRAAASRGEALLAAARARLGTFARLAEEQASPRVEGGKPRREEDPWNAWAWRGSLPGAASGPLAGLRVAVKDNTCVAGMPLAVGSTLLGGFVPHAHASVVARLVAAGAEIAGKAECEAFCFSGGSHTAASGFVRNPWDGARMAGGSSSGSAVLVAAGVVDAATGTDQGGSIAIPSAWCGIVGLKPTFGLLPYTGIVPVEPSLDHVGPMARRVVDVARLLAAMAGPDGCDPRQLHGPRPERGYVEAARDAADGRALRVGLLREAFAWPELSDPAVDARVETAVRGRFPHVAWVSVPEHRGANLVLGPISGEAARLLVEGPLAGVLALDPPFLPLAEALCEGWRWHEADPPATIAVPALAAGLARERFGMAPVLRAHERRRSLQRAVDEALTGRDVLALPTVPFRARPFPPRIPTVEEVLVAANTTHNTATFDLTGHPTLTLPAGAVGGLPVGVTLVARRGDEATLLRAGAWFEARPA